MTNHWLIIVGYLLFIILAFKSKDELLIWTASGLVLLYLFYAMFGQEFNFYNKGDLIDAGIYVILQIGAIIYIIRNKIRKEHLTWRPIVIILLFVTSLVLNKIMTTYGAPWFTGFILVTISFVIGLVLYRKELRFRKQQF